ncbi:MAG: putative Ig domain-containing protein, partial [Myxococcota bacterium]
DECGEAGGTRFVAGLDLDGDGDISEDEASESELFCNGEAGARTLVRVTPESPSGNCFAGGQRIRVGVDTNGDGILAVSEVDTQAFVCNLADPIVDVATVPVGDTNCPAGGQRLDAGLDTNGDGVLEAEEVVDTSYVCEGQDGAPVLVARTSVEPGADCSSGGVRVAVGTDDNRDGALNDAEEDTATFICSGDAGQDNGTGGAVRLAVEPVGPNCLGGGTRIETGLDADGNGVLDDAEVSSTRYVCRGQSANALVDILPELAGANCPEGGERVVAGRDANSDGTLQPEEITSSVFICSSIANVPIAIQTAVLTDALVNNPYVATIEAAGGVGGNYAWTVIGGVLPPGVTVDTTGTPRVTVSGSPSQPGLFAFTVQVTDFFGNTDTQEVSLTVAEPFDIGTYRLPRITQGAVYSATLTTIGGQPPFVWSVLDGQLPAGLSLSPDGRVSGTPTTTFGSYVVLQVLGGDGRTRRVGIDIKAQPRFIAYCGDVNTDGEDELVVGALSATGVVTSTVVVNFPTADADCIDEIEFAPNRDAIAFTGEETAGIEELFVADLSAFPSVTTYRVNEPYTSGDQDITDFIWSPTGNFLGYRADVNVNFREELYVADLTDLGSQSSTVAIGGVRVNDVIPGTSSALEVINFQWIPMSDKLVYASDEVVSSEQNLYFYDAATQEQRVQINSVLPTGSDTNSNYTLSPNGQWLAYTSDELVDNEIRLFVVDVSGGSPGTPQLFSEGFDPDGDVSTTTGRIAFSPNADLVAYVGDRSNLGNELYARSVREQSTASRRISPELTSTSFGSFGFRWSPDSRRIAVRGDYFTDSLFELYLLDVEVPGLALVASGSAADTSDVETINDTFAWSPNADYVVFEFDGVTASQDEPYLTFLSTPESPIRLFAGGIDDDVLRIKLSDDGSLLYTIVDFAGASVMELFVTQIDSNVTGTPTPVHPSPLATNQDVLEDFFVLEEGRAVAYISDEVTADVNEAFIRNIASGPVAGPAVRIHNPLPTGGDVARIRVQGE